MLKQVILDLENQLMQVKTQVAITVADERLLAQKRKENEDKHAEWTRKAELAVAKNNDELARAALERAVAHQRFAQNFAEQAADQKAEVENLKAALKKLEQKLADATAKADLLAARHRRSRALARAAEAHSPTPNSPSGTLNRIAKKVNREEAIGRAKNEISAELSVEEQIDVLEKDDEIGRLLEEIKSRRRV
jgi:phage shock protein A